MKDSDGWEIKKPEKGKDSGPAKPAIERCSGRTPDARIASACCAGLPGVCRPTYMGI
jgi:hypothetical protein